MKKFVIIIAKGKVGMATYYFFDKNKNGRTLTAPEKSGLAYSVAAILSAFLSLLFVIVLTALGQTGEEVEKQDWYRYLTFLIPQLASLLVIVWFVTFTQSPLLQWTGVKKTSWKYYLLAVALQIGLMSLSELNTRFIQLLSESGYVDSEIPLPNMDGFGFIGVIFVVAVLPAILEEGVFRGIILNGLKELGALVCCLICGGLFALYHQNPSQTIYQFICGSAFALVALRSGSALPTMLSHFINNALILTLTKFGVQTLPVWFYAASAVCLVGSLVYLIFFDKGQEEQPLLENKGSEAKQFFCCASVGLMIYAIVWVASLFV